MAFYANSSEFPKNNARNIKYIAVLVLLKFLDFEQNPLFSGKHLGCMERDTGILLFYSSIFKKHLDRWAYTLSYAVLRRAFLYEPQLSKECL